MPRVEADSSCGALRVPGLYAALLERERKRQERAERRSAVTYTYPAEDLAVMRRPDHLLRALEAGEPVVVRGHDLGGWSIPTVPLSPEQKDWPNWYTVTPDDRIVPAGYPVVDPIRSPSGANDDRTADDAPV
jgi:hypothetical protein